MRFPVIQITEDDMRAHEMISTHPDVRGSTNDILIAAIEECYSCAQVCQSCADACLAEDSVAELRQCIRLDLDCATMCLAAGEMASRRTGSNEAGIRLVLDACIAMCRMCAEECARHADMHEHCRICAESCRSCLDACDRAMRTITPRRQ